MTLTAPRRLAIRPKSTIDRMTLVSLLALFGIKRNRLELSRLDAEERSWVLRDCRSVWWSRIKTDHPDKGGNIEQAQNLNAAFDRVAHLLTPKSYLRPERKYEEPASKLPSVAPKLKAERITETPRAKRIVKLRLCVVCGNQCTKGRTTCSALCLAQRRVGRYRLTPELKRQHRTDYLIRTRAARKLVAAAWWAAHATQMADKRKKAA